MWDRKKKVKARETKQKYLIACGRNAENTEQKRNEMNSFSGNKSPQKSGR